jgi:4-amino-4-deoxy-L-arabinose transferase-like glycosyltransferase
MAVLSLSEKIVIFAGMIVFFRAGLWKLKRRRWRILAPAIFFITLLPSFFMIYSFSNINLRYMYFASVGVFMLVFAILEAYISDAPENKSSKVFVYGLIVVYLMFLGSISHYKNAHPLDRQTYPGDPGIIQMCVKTFGYAVPEKLYIKR